MRFVLSNVRPLFMEDCGWFQNERQSETSPSTTIIFQQLAVIAHRRFAHAGYSGVIRNTESSNHLDNNSQ